VLNEAFLKSPYVILVFSVNSSGCFQGYAKMTGLVGTSTKTHIFAGFGRAFDIRWLRLYDLDFSEVASICNPWNEGKSVKISRDGQELPNGVGKELCGMVDHNVYSAEPNGYVADEAEVETGGFAPPLAPPHPSPAVSGGLPPHAAMEPGPLMPPPGIQPGPPPAGPPLAGMPGHGALHGAPPWSSSWGYAASAPAAAAAPPWGVPWPAGHESSYSSYYSSYSYTESEEEESRIGSRTESKASNANASKDAAKAKKASAKKSKKELKNAKCTERTREKEKVCSHAKENAKENGSKRKKAEVSDQKRSSCISGTSNKGNKKRKTRKQEKEEQEERQSCRQGQ